MISLDTEQAIFTQLSEPLFGGWCLVPGVPLCRDNAGLTSSAATSYQLPATACHENSCMHALAGLGWAGRGGETI